MISSLALVYYRARLRLALVLCRAVDDAKGAAQVIDRRAVMRMFEDDAFNRLQVSRNLARQTAVLPALSGALSLLGGSGLVIVFGTVWPPTYRSVCLTIIGAWWLFAITALNRKRILQEFPSAYRDEMLSYGRCPRCTYPLERAPHVVVCSECGSAWQLQ